MKKCKKCSINFNPTKGLINFCSLSCRNSNIKSKETRLKIGNSNKLIAASKPKKTTNNRKFCVLKWSNCKICKNAFFQRSFGTKVTCSEECRVIASTKIRKYQNGSRKPEWYFNINEGKEVLLESSWEIEIAKFLDEHRIKWIRPKFINWFDEHKQKNRIYFPDFYLTDYDIYLDPKNPYCMSIDKHKMEQISKQVELIFGDKEYIKKRVMVFNG